MRVSLFKIPAKARRTELDRDLPGKRPDLFRRRINPHLADLLEAVGLDKCFVKGMGSRLFDHSGTEYLDFVAAYGALPFGHTPPEIWQVLQAFPATNEPVFVQPSLLNAAGDLADRLLAVAPAGLDYVTFANSGAETVEAAIKLSRAYTGRRGILSAKNSFHGKTLGALSATGKASYQEDFFAPVEGFSYVRFGDLEELEKTLIEKPDFYAALILEPIQGEGGIIEAPAGYLKEAGNLCRSFGLVFILDEIQTGLGRTGRLFACQDEEFGANPDVLLLAKALGGGVLPIGACLSSARVFTESFAMKHSSTFAGNSLACRVGLRTLDLLTGKTPLESPSEGGSGLVENAARYGRFLKEGMLTLQKEYPEFIKSVRGRGLMLGLQFTSDRNTLPGSFLGVMVEQEMLTPVLSAYLLNVERVRVAPTLNGKDVIRVEPCLNVTLEECRWFLQGLARLLAVLKNNNTAKLLSHLLGIAPGQIPAVPETVKRGGTISAPPTQGFDGRFAFLVNPVDLENYPEFDPSLAAFNSGQLRQLAAKWNHLVHPFIIAQTEVVSKTGRRVFGEFIAIPLTAHELMDLPVDEVRRTIAEAVVMGKTRGANIVGLGAYTSVVSAGGITVRNLGVPITTGNSYTVVAAVDAVQAAFAKMGETMEKSVVAVVGATGSIGKCLAVLMAEKAARLVLVGNPHGINSRERLKKVSAEVFRHLSVWRSSGGVFPAGSMGFQLSSAGTLPPADAPLVAFEEFAESLDEAASPVVLSHDIGSALPAADIVICATSHMEVLVQPEMLKHGAVVCDVSRPANVNKETMNARPDVLVIDGGVVEVPGKPDLGWNFGFERGEAYACMSETMMLALEGHFQHTSLGSSGVNPESVRFTRNLAEKHGFHLAAFKSFNFPLLDSVWERVITARNRSRMTHRFP
jgi:acetylornithine/succinyldiaminopimelate/putrescine aminotransferase/predicted amino acid dehydrogenase